MLRAIRSDPGFELQLIVAGMHLSPDFGMTASEIEKDGFEIAARVEMLVDSESPEGIAKSIGLGVSGFAEVFSQSKPDILLLVGDRYELLAAASAALPFLIPLAHISGGDVTEGSFDNQVRHAISKMSHLHFVSMDAHRERLLQMGEEPWRIFVTGDPALDSLGQIQLPDRPELAKDLGLELNAPVVMVSYHPPTLDLGMEAELEALLGALERLSGTFVFTYPNADPQSHLIIQRLRRFVAGKSNVGLFFNLGQAKYYGLMAVADLMVGNSSSGIWEAPSFSLPGVNIGQRQQGRLRAGNVIDVAGNAEDIYQAMLRGLKPDFREGLRGLTNPYGTGNAVPIIMETLGQIALGPALMQKHFIDIPRPTPVSN